MWLLSNIMKGYKATTCVVAIIWTDDSTSVSQGAYSKFQSVAFVVQIAYSVLIGKKKNILNINRHRKANRKNWATEDVSL